MSKSPQEWYTDLAGELKTVIKGEDHTARKETIQNIIDTLEHGEPDSVQISTRLRQAELGWFADRLDNLEFHNRNK